MKDMNATSLYVSSCRLVLQADPEEESSWQDLARLLPYLRASLSCTVCCSLLIEPYTPTETSCQHHVCKSCKGGKKNLRPSCSWCKDYEKYIENVQLRILLQSYKKLCFYIASTPIYKKIGPHKIVSDWNNDHLKSLVDVINEGTGFEDNFSSSGTLNGLAGRQNVKLTSCVNAKKKSVCNSSTQTLISGLNAKIGQNTSTSTASSTETIKTIDESLQEPTNDDNDDDDDDDDNDNDEMEKTPSCSSSHSDVSNESQPINIADDCIKTEVKTEEEEICEKTSLPPNTTSYSVIESKINPLKCIDFNKDDIPAACESLVSTSIDSIPPEIALKRFKQKGNKIKNKRKGCRCGNATPTPGKLTCCGQRCPCYVAAKICFDCRCRGCRNPHRPGGKKVPPVLSHVLGMPMVSTQLATVKLQTEASRAFGIPGNVTNALPTLGQSIVTNSIVQKNQSLQIQLPQHHTPQFNTHLTQHGENLGQGFSSLQLPQQIVNATTLSQPIAIQTQPLLHRVELAPTMQVAPQYVTAVPIQQIGVVNMSTGSFISGACSSQATQPSFNYPVVISEDTSLIYSNSDENSDVEIDV